MMTNHDKNLGKIIKQRRLMAKLTLRQMSVMTGVSSSHLSRIERGERFPSALILQKISKPLDFSETELLKLAGLLSPQTTTTESETGTGRLDPYVARALSQEPVQVQHTVIMILTILKTMRKA